MIKFSEIVKGQVIYRAFMEVREYAVLTVGDDYLFVKRPNDLSYIKVFDFEFKEDLWHLTEELADSKLSEVNKLEEVSCDDILYTRKSFTVKNEQAMAGDVIYESCYYGSRFIGKTAMPISIVLIEIVDIVSKDNILYAKVRVKDTTDEEREPEEFFVERDTLCTMSNLFLNPQALYTDRYRTAKSNIHEFKLLYRTDKHLYMSLTESEKNRVNVDLGMWTKAGADFDKAYEGYLDKNKKYNTSVNAEKDAEDILLQL